MFSMIKIQRKNKNDWGQSWLECEPALTPEHGGQEGKMVQPLRKTVWKKIWQIFVELDIHLPYDTTIPLLSIDPSKIKFMFSQKSNWKYPKYASPHEQIHTM